LLYFHRQSSIATRVHFFEVVSVSLDLKLAESLIKRLYKVGSSSFWRISPELE